MHYTLQENNAGGLLLTVKENSDKLLIFTFTPKTMGEYLHLLRDGADLETMENEAWVDTVDPDEHDKYSSEWQDSPVIADSAGVYPERAGVAGEKALQIADLYADPLETLKKCESADAVRQLVLEHESIVCPVPFTAAPHDKYARHECAWNVCQIMWDIAEPETFEDLQSIVYNWSEVCRELLGAEGIELRAQKKDVDYFPTDDFENADFIELACYGVSYYGLKTFDLSDRLASLLNCELLSYQTTTIDGESEWHVFDKRKR